MVKFEGSVTQTQINNLLSSLDCETIKVMSTGAYLVQYSITPPVDPLELCDDFLEDGIIESAKNNTE